MTDFFDDFKALPIDAKITVLVVFALLTAGTLLPIVAFVTDPCHKEVKE